MFGWELTQRSVGQKLENYLFVFHTVVEIDKISNYTGDCVVLCLSPESSILHVSLLRGVYGLKTFENLLHKANR